MANEIKLTASSRTEFGKGASRRLRATGQVPAVVYGHGTDPVHIALPGHETLLALRTANALLSISVDGGAGQLALPKQVQRDPIKGVLEHVDLLVVKRGEKVSVEVPLIVTGADKEDRVLVVDQQTLTLEVEATHIPSEITIDVSGLEIGAQLTAAELPLPEGAVYAGEAEDRILSISAARTAAELEADLAGEGDAEAGEAEAE